MLAWRDDARGVVWATRPPHLLPPAGHPQRATWQKRDALLTNRLLGLPDVDGNDGASQQQRHQQQGSAAAASDEVVLAPEWLVCGVGHRTLRRGWAALRPPLAPCALLHLVDLRSSFGHFDAHKANRRWVTASYAASRLAPPRRAGEAMAVATMMVEEEEERAAAATAVLRLSPALVDASAGLESLLGSLRTLAVAAAVTGRAPVVPSVACTAAWLHRSAATSSSTSPTLLGVDDERVLQLRDSVHDGAGVRCHLALGGAACLPPLVVPEWLVPSLPSAPSPPVATLRVASNASMAASQLREAVALLGAATTAELSLEAGWAQHPRGWLEAVEASLRPGEARRYSRLRRACPGYFDPACKV